jgi:hypothetical protein
MQAANTQQLTESRAIGRPGAELGDRYATYGYRQQTLDGEATKGYAGGRLKELNHESPAELARQDALRDIPGGTGGVNAIAKDATLRKLMDNGQPMLGAEYVRRQHLGMDVASQQRLADLKSASQKGAMTRAERLEMNTLEDTFNKAPHLADWNGTLDPRYAAEQLDFFGNHPLTDHTLGQIAHNRAQAGGQAIHELLANNLSTTAGPDTINAMEALRRVGLNNEVQTPTGLVGGRSYLLDKLKAKNPTAYATAGIDDLANMHIPASLVEDAAKFQQVVRTPDALNPVVKAWDSITNLTKAGQTSLWPSFHVRNLVTGLWQNLVGGARDARYGAFDPRAWSTPYKDAMALRNNGVIQGAKDIYAARTQNGVGADFVNNTGGFYDAQTKTMAAAAGEDAARNLRHERVHAIVDQASQGQGKMGDLPYLMQAPARLKASSKPLLQDAGVMMDELAAQTLENRSLGGQMKGAMSYLFHPDKNATYTQMYKAGGLDPRLISAYSSLPGAMAGSGAAAGASAPAFARMLGGE